MENTLVPVLLIGWVPIVLGLFAALPPRRAVIVAFLLAWLFLPMAGYRLAGLPDYTKMSATCVGVLLGILLFDNRRFADVRAGWLDLPMIVWCLCPLASSLANGLGMYDGVSAVVTQTITWGVPYFVGRMYFQSSADLHELAVWLVIGGLIYVPLCLYEIRMSPQLHRMVYGLHQHDWTQTKRFGGFRPTVFMQHGLMVGMWMCMTALVGFWLWSTRVLPRTLLRVPTGWAVALLLLTALLCKSTGAVVLLFAGVSCWFASRFLGTRLVVAALLLAAPLYCTTRVAGLWDGAALVSIASEWISEGRAWSLQTRLTNEDALIDKAMQRPAFGWGGWGRARVYNEWGRDTSVTDGLWVIALGNYGLAGLTSLTFAMLLAPSVAIWRHGCGPHFSKAEAAVVVSSVVVVLYWIDCIPNGMVNPIFAMVAGGLTSVVLAERQLMARLTPAASHSAGPASTV